MKSSTRKRIVLCIVLLIIGAFGGYLFAKHHTPRRVHEHLQHHRQGIHSIFEDSMNDLKQREKEIDKLFNELEKSHDEERSNLQKEFENKKITSGDASQAKGSFQYIQRTNLNGKESSYEVNGNWNEGETTGTMLINGKNSEGKEFSYSGTMENGQSTGTMMDEDGNSKSVNFESINLNTIYENSNNIAN